MSAAEAALGPAVVVPSVKMLLSFGIPTPSQPSRRLCLWRWSDGKLNWGCDGLVKEWKKSYLWMTRQERQMTLAKADDFIYKETTEEVGMMGLTAYMWKNNPRIDDMTPVVCTVSSIDRLHTWDVRKGNLKWTSPELSGSITHLKTVPQMRIAVTMDTSRAINVWDCVCDDAVSTFVMPYRCYSLEAFISMDGPILTVGDITGDIYTFTLPELNQISRVKAFQFRIDVLLCSPHKQWVFACGLQQHTYSKVFLMENLLKPSAGPCASFSLPFLSCIQANWIPNRESKIVLMYQSVPRKIGFMTLSLTTKKIGDKTNIEVCEVGNFLLPNHIDGSDWMGVSEEELIILGSGTYLFIFTTNGILLRQVDDHLTAIMHLRVDHIRVLATTVDGSLHLYAWEEGGRYPYLKKCCELKSVTPNFTLDRYFYDAICDNDSIVRVVSSETSGFSILMLYTLKTSLQS
ncbi:F-box/WD repeat-containing protein 12 [Ochotona princeps]|uniref:F-box/WD repeat-containing protein 12 n=1 Tax=Ochotona princeps TaxID=9978 RepID=UPI002714BE2C|nr:F-box/WD repeat-containing protein 12 [Ochotona princeps]